MAKILKINPQEPELPLIREAAGLIKAGEVVAFPTETVYGLGADATSVRAIGKIFAAKGRPADNPLIVHIAEPADLDSIAAHVPAEALRLAERFWPGPLTMILPKTSLIPDIVTAGLDTVAVRIPDNLIALELIRASGVPMAAPSANISGKPSPTTADHVAEDLGELIPLIVDGGPAIKGVESTVIDLTSPQLTILRPGVISMEEIESYLGQTIQPQPSKEEFKSPGTKYRHYSPRAEILIVEGSNRLQGIRQLTDEFIAEGKSVAILTFEESLPELGDLRAIAMSTRKDLAAYSQRLYAELRDLDAQSVDVILVEELPGEGIGRTLQDRLHRAAKAVLRF